MSAVYYAYDTPVIRDPRVCFLTKRSRIFNIKTRAGSFDTNSMMESRVNLSLSNDTDSAFYKQWETTVILKLTAQVLIATFGVIGNALVITVLKAAKKIQPGEFYLMNLAIADLGTLLLTFPIVALKQHSPSWLLGRFTCLYLTPFTEVFHGASVWFIAVIAVERYRQVVTVKMVLKNPNKASWQKAKIVATCVWVTSFLIFSLPMYFIVGHQEPEGCAPNWPSEIFIKIYNGLLTFFSYLLPLLVISFTYVIISRTLTRSNLFIIAMKRDQLSPEQNGKDLTIKSARLSQNNRAKKILTPLVLVFALTMLPLNIIRFAVVLHPPLHEKNFYVSLLFVVAVFVLLNSSSNPVIYSVVSRDFRQRVNNFISGGRGIAKQNTLLVRQVAGRQKVH